MLYQIFENCRLEFQTQRGVLYVCNRDTGETVLRISNLKPHLFTEGMLDLTVGASKGKYNFLEERKSQK